MNRTDRPPGLVLSDLTLSAIQAEATRAHLRHGPSSILNLADDRDRFDVLAEEVGEVARELNERRIGNTTPGDYRLRIVKELVQVGAMAATFIEAVEGQADDPRPHVAVDCPCRGYDHSFAREVEAARHRAAQAFEGEHGEQWASVALATLISRLWNIITADPSREVPVASNGPPSWAGRGEWLPDDETPHEGLTAWAASGRRGKSSPAALLASQEARREPDATLPPPYGPAWVAHYHSHIPAAPVDDCPWCAVWRPDDDNDPHARWRPDDDEDGEIVPADYDPGPEVDDEGGMSERRYIVEPDEASAFPPPAAFGSDS
jgi:hypothetical protein